MGKFIVAILSFSLFPQTIFAAMECNLALSGDGPLELIMPQNHTRNFFNAHIFIPGASDSVDITNITLDKWYELKPHKGPVSSIVGISPDQSIYHVIRFGGHKTIARIIGGQRKYKDFRLTENNDLIAIDKDDVLYLYSSKVWSEKGVVQNAFSKGLKLTAKVALASALFFEFIVLGENSTIIDELYAYLPPLATAIAYSMYSLYRFEEASFADGFVLISASKDIDEGVMYSDIRALRSEYDFSIENAEHLDQ